MVNINQIMKQAQAMQKKMADMQEQLGTQEFTGSAGGGLLTITVNGKGEVAKVKIDPTLVEKDDVEVLEDLIIAAYKDAKKKADENSESSMSGMMGNLGLPPGFKMPF
jgi:DNA-binding YbaB/EbfC family protein